LHSAQAGSPRSWAALADAHIAACTLLDAWGLLLRLLGEPAKVAAGLPCSLEVSGGWKV